MMRTTIFLKLEIEGKQVDARHVLNEILDEGSLQHMIENHNYDAGELRIINSLITSSFEFETNEPTKEHP